MVNIFRRSLDAGDAGVSHGVRPHISVVVDLAEFERRAPVVCTSIRNDAAQAGRLSRATLDHLLCDCSISRVIVDGPSQVLDVGRATRTISSALWKALVVRDRHCRAPGCDRPPGWCEGHHIWPWEHGGPTDLDNLQLLCWHHHRAEHQRAARSP
jgi:5-methylcytosine-specific restriction protein A